jgi:ABC-type glycerol-3-phosphate transport system substrate-binding protein
MGGAYLVAQALTSKEALRAVSKDTGLPPVHLGLLSELEQDPYRAQFNKAALVSRAWLDPNPEESDRIFRNMIEAIKSGKMTINEAVNAADMQFTALLNQ